MILKKPYGLLIKHFRLIHLMLLILMIIFSIKSKSVVNFFVDYVKNDYSVTIMDNMASLYISPFIYVVLALIIVMALAIYILLKYKKKPNKVYIITILYYIFMTIMIIIASYLINSLSEGFWQTANARQYSDIYQMIYYPQFIFIIIFGIRTLGFDIKKFDFKKDLQDFDLSSSDSELVEVNLDFDFDKVMRKIRKMIRELGYYIKENTYIFIFIILILVGVSLYFSFKNYEKATYSYNQGEKIYYDNFEINFTDSIISSLSYNGDEISSNGTFLITKFNIKNNFNKAKKLDYENFKIYIGDKVYYPNLDLGYNFKDYAQPYFGEIINPDEEKTYQINYKIPKKYKNKPIKVVLYNGYSIKKKEFLPKTIEINLKPIEVNDKKIVAYFNVGDEINFNGSYLENSIFKINDYYIGRSYKYQYRKCYDGICKDYNDIISVDYTQAKRKTLIVLDYDFIIDKDTQYYNSVQSVNGFIKDFACVRYIKNDKEKTSDILNITPHNINNKVILQVSDEITDADSIDILLTLRNKIYVINLFNKIKTNN